MLNFDHVCLGSATTRPENASSSHTASLAGTDPKRSVLNARGLAKNKHRRRQTKLPQRDSVMTCGPFAVLVATAVFHPRKFGACHSTANIPVEGYECWQKDPDTRRRPSYPVSDRWRTRNEKGNERTAS